MGRIMSTVGESSFVFTSAISVEGVLPPSVSAPRSSLPSTPLTPASRVVQPPIHSNLAGTFGDMVTGIPSIPTVPSSFPYITQSGPVGSSAFVPVIFRAQKLDFIYSQFGLLYEIIPNYLHSSFDPKIKPGPHADGIVGCTSAKPAD